MMIEPENLDLWAAGLYYYFYYVEIITTLITTLFSHKERYTF